MSLGDNSQENVGPHRKYRTGDKHPLEYLIAGLLFLTLLATTFAAWSTGGLVKISQDTELRQLRGYIYPNIKNIVFAVGDPGLTADVTVEVTGLTPVYNVKVKAQIAIIGDELMTPNKLDNYV